MLDLTHAVVIGFFSLPSPALAEYNPTAYNSAMASVPAGAGSCQHCGTGILHHVVIRLADGQKAFIGSDCATRVGDPTVRRCVREKLTAAQIAERETKAKARRAEWRLEEEAAAARLAVRFESLRDIIEALEALGSEFHSSLASQLRIDSLSHRQAEYAVKGILGRHNKRNAQQWDSLYERCTN